MVVFARQNLIADPPFSRMDLINCRNLLIYLEPSLQQKALPTFHYALKPEGFLVLGASESISGFTDLFESVDNKQKIYSKKAAPTRAFHLPVRKEHDERSSPGRRPQTPLPLESSQGGALEGFHGELNAQREADRITLNRFTPPGVLVNADLQILQFRGATGAYLEPPAGKASFDVLKMARPGLMLALRAAINQAKKDNKTARRDHIRLTQNGETRMVNVEVIPLKNVRERCVLILFEDVEQAERSRAPSRDQPQGAVRTARPSSKQEESRLLADSERELSETREYLQSVQEQHEAATEELQAANEEVQSANEELQSTNEELETSKEELESANEELTTVNEEMSNRNVELNRLNNDLVNFQHSTKLALLLVGRDLTLLRFSPQAQKQFDLLTTDVGRPIGHLGRHLALADGAEPRLDLEGLSADVTASMHEQACEVQDTSGRWHSLRARPYVTLDNKVEGAVLVLMDIDALKRSEGKAKATREYAENVVETVREPLLVLDRELRVESANRSFYRTFSAAPVETIGQFVFELANHQWDIPRLRALLAEVLAQGASIEDFQVECDLEVGLRTMLLNARSIFDPHRKIDRILLAIEDITERKRTESLLSSQKHVFEMAAVGASLPEMLEFLLRTFETQSPKKTQVAIHMLDESGARFLQTVAPSLPPAYAQAVDGMAVSSAGGTCCAAVSRRQHVSVSDIAACQEWPAFAQFTLPLGLRASFSTPIVSSTGRILGTFVSYDHEVREPNPQDVLYGDVVTRTASIVIERKQAETALRQNEVLFSTLVDQAPNGMYVVDAQFRMQQVNSRALPVFAAVHPLIGRDFSEVIKILWGPEVGGDIADIFRHTLETGERYISPSSTNRREDLGVEQSYEWETQRLTLPDGEHAVVCYFTDITGLKHGERARDRLAAIIESSEDAIYSEDLNGVITSWNRGAERLFGYIAPEAVGRHMSFLDPSGRIDGETSSIGRIRQGEFVEQYETMGRCEDGTLVDIALTISPIKNDQGKILGISNIARDITDRKRAREELEQRVVDRTQELVQAHERERALATELNLTEQRERKRLATDMHDYLAQLLVLGKMKLDQSKRPTQTVEKRDALIEEMDAVLSDALAYTRTLVIDLCPPILHEFGLPAALKWLGERMQRHELTVTVQIDTDDLQLPEDRALLLFQSVRELLMNVVKHARSDTATVRVEQDSSALRIEVQDQGVGFTPGASGVHGGDPASSSKFGLFSIRERMMSLGGRFELHSTPGNGATATLVLPLGGRAADGSGLKVLRSELGRSEPGVSSNQVRNSELKTQTLHQQGAKIRVLLVDDHAMVRQGLRSVLESYPDVGVVGEGVNGEEAVVAAEALQPSHVVMDVNMPKMNGIEATTRITSRYPHVIVIGLSVNATPAIEELMIRAGAARLLSKDGVVNELYQAIQETLG